MTTVIIQKTRRGRNVTITPDKVLIDGVEVFGAQADEQRQRAIRISASGARADASATVAIVNIGSVVGRQVVVSQRAGTIVNIDGDLTVVNGRVVQSQPRKRR